MNTDQNKSAQVTTVKKTFRETLFGRIFKGFTIQMAIEFLFRSIEANPNLTEDEKDKANDFLHALAAILLPSD